MASTSRAHAVLHLHSPENIGISALKQNVLFSLKQSSALRNNRGEEEGNQVITVMLHSYVSIDDGSGQTPKLSNNDDDASPNTFDICQTLHFWKYTAELLAECRVDHDHRTRIVLVEKRSKSEWTQFYLKQSAFCSY